MKLRQWCIKKLIKTTSKVFKSIIVLSIESKAIISSIIHRNGNCITEIKLKTIQQKTVLLCSNNLYYRGKKDANKRIYLVLRQMVMKIRCWTNNISLKISIYGVGEKWCNLVRKKNKKQTTAYYVN